MKKTPYRVMQKFWLDVTKPDENELLNYIHTLKNPQTRGGSRYSFAATIRDGLRLIRDLRAGKVDVLIELFPWIEELLIAKTAAAPRQESPIFSQLERLEKLLLAQGNVPISRLDSGKWAQKSDDDLIVESIQPAQNKRDNNSGWNMIIAATLQNLGHCNALGAEIRAYGVRTNRIPKGALSPENWQQAQAHNAAPKLSEPPKPAAPNRGGGPKPIALPSSFTPSSEDDERDDDLLEL